MRTTHRRYSPTLTPCAWPYILVLPTILAATTVVRRAWRSNWRRCIHTAKKNTANSRWSTKLLRNTPRQNHFRLLHPAPQVPQKLQPTRSSTRRSILSQSHHATGSLLHLCPLTPPHQSNPALRPRQKNTARNRNHPQKVSWRKSRR